MIVRRRGKGTHIAPLMSADEARVLFETRITLESYLTQQAAFRLTDEQLRVLHELTDAFRALVASNAVERELIELDSRYHMTIYEGAQEDFLLSIVESYWSRLIRELGEAETFSRAPNSVRDSPRVVRRAARAHPPRPQQPERRFRSAGDGAAHPIGVAHDRGSRGRRGRPAADKPVAVPPEPGRGAVAGQMRSGPCARTSEVARGATHLPDGEHRRHPPHCAGR